MIYKAVLPVLRPVLRRVQSVVYGWLNNPRFIWVIIGLFVLQSLWIALTARYPQAFDENFHFGLIQLHAKQLLPFFTEQPAGADIYGAAWRDPSYFYYYIMSWPYRLLTALTSSVTLQIVVLRLVNIAMFASGIVVYQKLLSRLGLSRRITYVTLLFFVLLPVVPLLAGQINYDNLIFPLTGLLFLYAVRYLQALSKQRTIDVAALQLVLLFGLLAAIVKYTSLPVFVAVLAMLLIVTVMAVRARDSTLTLMWPGRLFLVLFSLITLLLAGLCLERYAINLVRYHSLQPDCAKVLTVAQCQSYSPWARDHVFAHIYPRPTPLGIAVYPFVWVHRTIYETMFTIGSYFAADGTVTYSAAKPLPIANFTGWTITVAGFLFCLLFMRRLWQQRELRLLLLVSAFYIVVLFVKNFSMYLHTGEAVAIHGRYLIPIFPLLLVMLVLGFSWTLEAIRKPHYKTWLVIVCLLFFIPGGGITAWIVRGDTSWVWQESAPAQSLNSGTQMFLERLILH